MGYAKLLSPAVLYKFDQDFGVTYIPPKQEPRVVVTMRLPDDYPHQSTRPSYKKKSALMEAQNHRCAYCQVEVWTLPHMGRPHQKHDCATIDHFVAMSKGGRRTWSNEIIACLMCNGGRGNIDAMAYFEKVKSLGREAAARWGAMMQAMI